MEQKFIQEAILEARRGMEQNHGGPFGSVIVKNGKIIGRGHNRVLETKDPTSHAEMNAIRAACRHENNFWLQDCEIYTSCEPCPMCFSAIYWARIDVIYAASDRHAAAEIGFDDRHFFDEMRKDISERQIQLIYRHDNSIDELFADWLAKTDKVLY